MEANLVVAFPLVVFKVNCRLPFDGWWEVSGCTMLIVRIVQIIRIGEVRRTFISHTFMVLCLRHEMRLEFIGNEYRKDWENHHACRGQYNGQNFP